MIRWEYAQLEFRSASSQTGTGQWYWTQTADLWLRFKLVARWRCTVPPAPGTSGELAVGTQLNFTPVSGASPEFDRTVTSPLDYLGDNGWEIVGSTVLSSGIRTGNDIGWQTSMSEPRWIEYLLKREQTR